MQRRFGFESNGVGFYLFDEIADPKEFKQTYRDELDRATWDGSSPRVGSTSPTGPRR
jgi:heme oxygenase